MSGAITLKPRFAKVSIWFFHVFAMAGQPWNNVSNEQRFGDDVGLAMNEDNGWPILRPSSEIEDLLLAIVSIGSLVFFVFDHFENMKSLRIDTKDRDVRCIM